MVVPGELVTFHYCKELLPTACLNEAVDLLPGKVFCLMLSVWDVQDLDLATWICALSVYCSQYDFSFYLDGILSP